MSGKNVLNGFSRILDIQKFSEGGGVEVGGWWGGGSPDPPLKYGIHGVNPHFTKLSSSPPLPATGGVGGFGRGGGGS